VTDAAKELRERYLREAVETATPAERLVMIYDRLCVDLRRAAQAFEQKDFYAINKALVHAQEIVIALAETLDTERWGAAQQLKDLYGYWCRELVWMNLEKDPTSLPALTKMVEQVTEAWRAAKDLAS
jgi:flagellar protein FliS